MTTNQSELQTQQTPTKRLVRGISFQQKLAILRQLEAGVSRKEICENFQCCQSTISRVLVTKHAILELAEQDKNLNRKRVGMVTYKDIDDALSKWALEMKRSNQMITSGLAKQKAEEIARELGEDFMPSAGWLYKWKERENVQFCKKAKGGEQMMDSGGSEEILKGLLEKREGAEDDYIHQSKKLKALEGYNQMENDNCDTAPQKEQELENNVYTEQNTGQLQDTTRIPQQKTLQMLRNNPSDPSGHQPRINNLSTLLQQQQIQQISDEILDHNQRQLPADTKFESLDENALENTSNQTRSESLTSPAKKDSNNATPPATPALVFSSKLESSTPKHEPRKVHYSYDPVYVLTSTGRYRKEKTFLTLLQKLEILDRLKNGEKRSDLINEYRLSQSAMCQIIADEKKITRMAAIGQNLQMKRIRGGIFKAGESELNTWVLAKMEMGETLTRNQVKNKAKEIAERMHLEFKASTGWLEKWKARMNMDFNEKQILYRKKPQYINKSDMEEAHTSQHLRSFPYPEVSYGEEDDEAHISLNGQRNLQRQLDEAEDYHMGYNGDSSIDVKPFTDSQEQYYPEVVTVVEDDDEEEKDIKPFINSPPNIIPDDSSSSSSDDDEPLHQQIIGWLNRYNIAPTAATELLTMLHPVISDKPDAPQQTRLTITTKPASRSKGRPYAQHTYS